MGSNPGIGTVFPDQPVPPRIAVIGVQDAREPSPSQTGLLRLVAKNRPRKLVP
jgi:hypothetical protein